MILFVYRGVPFIATHYTHMFAISGSSVFDARVLRVQVLLAVVRGYVSCVSGAVI